MSRTGLAQAIRAAVSTARAAGDSAQWARCPSAMVRMFGAAASVVYQPDPAEVARRDATGAGAITDLAVLDALMGLPANAPVDLASLSERELRALRRAPRGAVSRDNDHLVRRVVAPVSAQFALVAARNWQEGLVKAGRYAPYCERAMLLPTQPADLDDVRMQASFYGIGIYVFEAGALQTLASPEPFVRMRHTPAQWWFVEEIYRQVTVSATAG